MKNLTLLSQDTAFKLGDTGTKIQFRASNDGNSVGLSTGQTANFRIKNDIGFLKTVQADTSVGGYVFELDTSQLTSLVPGTYEVELDITVSQGDDLIFPDTGFVSFSISQNALNITGEQLPMMNLQDFKNEVLQYTQQQISGMETQIENQFQQYVDNLQSSTIKQAQEATDTANKAAIFANTYTLDQLFTGAIPNVDKPADFKHIPQGVYSGNGWSATVNSQPDFPTIANQQFFLLQSFTVQNAFTAQVIYLQSGKVYEQIISSDYTIAVPWAEISATSTNPVISNISDKVTANASSITSIQDKIANLFPAVDITAKAGITITTCDSLTSTGVYTFNAWAPEVQKVSNLPFANCWGTMIVLPFASLDAGNVIQIAFSDTGLVKYRTEIGSSFGTWRTISVSNS